MSTQKRGGTSTSAPGAQEPHGSWPRWFLLSLITATVALALAGGNTVLDHGGPSRFVMSYVPPSLLSLEQRVDRILSRTPLLDGHDDLAEQVRAEFQNQIYTPEFRAKFEQGSMPGHFDLPRLKKGRQGGLFWSAWVDCPVDKYDFSNENYAPVVMKGLAQVDVIHRLQSAHSDIFSPPTLDTTAAVAAFRRHGKLLSPIGVEGLHMIGRNASLLRLYHSLGARYMTLTWNCHNAFADAAQVTVNLDDSLALDAARPAKPHWGGLSPLGSKLMNEMNRLGIMIDLSHTHPVTMHDVLAGNLTKSYAGSRAPVIFSHSSAHALCPHPRNVPDNILPLVKQTNSVVMVTFVPEFVSCVNSSNPDVLPTFYPANSTLGFVADHIMYIGQRIGFEHVGIGSDFDGTPETPRGLEDVSKFPDLVAELLNRGLTDDQVEGIVGGNVLRVWKKVEDVSRELQANGEVPMEDEI
ncbi:membrane dipeptidase [Capronia coronata CBS 617.96]|uniref:Dipeptidase n=1 Tax=Capronia coronata CBS 617.96 TaxID=1182541 RepID=W9XEL5_9EURO|nr:membrane dipeptidase [Capronia coronata CBS 617.96]EXJ78673.1 membrane dipeptidase [Capronia coronata CBS 617.96]